MIAMARAEAIMADLMQTHLQIKTDQKISLKACKQEAKGDIEMTEAPQPQSHSEVILFVDNREKRNQQDGNYLFDRLSKNNFRIELKSLPLGDFLWVLRVHHPQH